MRMRSPASERSKARSRDRLLGDGRHVGRQRPGRRGRHAPGLAEQADHGVDQVGGQAVGVGEDQAVGGEGDPLLADPGAQVEAPLELLGLEDRGGHRAGELGDKPVMDGAGGAGNDGLELLVRRLAVDEGRAGEGARVEMDRDQVGDALAGVGDGHVEVVLLPGAHRLRVAHGHGKVGVAHQHRADRAAGDLHRTDRQAVEGGGDLELDLVRPLLEPFDGEIGLPRLGRAQLADVVGWCRSGRPARRC